MTKAQAIEISRFGPPEVLRLRKETIGKPEPHEVIIQVKAVGLNFADIFERLGLYAAAPKAPFVPGFEVAGVVEAIGEKVRDFEVGQKVLGVTRFGAYKSHIRLAQDFVKPMPDHFSFAEAAGFPTTYLTAYHGMVTLGHIKPGEDILIHAAAGGVGTAAVQIAQIFDARIFATCGSQAKVDFLRSLGDMQLINYREQDFEKEIRRLNNGQGVDLIMDSVGGKTFRKGYRLLNPMGRLVIFGLGSMMPAGRRPNWLKLAYQYLTLPRFNPFKMMPENKTISAFHLAYMFQFVEEFHKAMQQLLTWANEGKLRPLVGKTFPFEQAAQAHRYLQSRQSTGKVILTLE